MRHSFLIPRKNSESEKCLSKFLILFNLTALLDSRLVLPVPMYHNDYNIWSVLKNCIGKELSKITMPVVFNEPLSFLQRMAEYMEYSYLLRLATEQEDPCIRMQYVIAKVIEIKEAYTWSNVQCCVHNIIVGKLWMEQVGNMEITSYPSGCKAHLTFKSAGCSNKDLHRVEGYVVNKSKNKINYIYGKWTEFLKCTDYGSYEDYVKENPSKFSCGNMKCSNESPSHTSKKVLQKLNSLKVPSFRSNSTQETVNDFSADSTEETIPKSDSTYSIDIPNSVTIWNVKPRPLQSSDYYQFTEFAMSLNELEPGMEKPYAQLTPDYGLILENWNKAISMEQR
ncbi:hypothetical protein NQ318_012511 [Aromia moschata]|uniref:Oxysterol-binding protein n=1 Tax=Aromia moschata TaxID=1265417 RepID=A0AAV8XCD9_9CUCU|nr:hypothetical protein NQ318_012511 [Aromia moschata]